MRQKSFGLGWLDRNNGKQQQWACSYLLKKGSIERSDEPLTHEELLLVGEELERLKAGRVIIKQMNNAWRQMEYRAPNKGRKACTFKLKAEVKKELTSLAKKNGTDKTDLLSTLISDGSIAYAKLKAQLSNAQKSIDKLKKHNDTLTNLLRVSMEWLSRSEILLQDVALSTESITEDQQRRIETLHRAIMSGSYTAIRSPGTLSPQQLFERATRGVSSYHAQKKGAADSAHSVQDSSTTQVSPISRELCVDSERQRPSTPEAPPGLDPALTIKIPIQIDTHSDDTRLETASEENASPPPFEKAKPHPSPQSAATINDDNRLTDRPASENLEAQSQTDASSYVETDLFPPPTAIQLL